MKGPHHHLLAIAALGLALLTGCAGTPPPATIDPATNPATPASQTTANPLAIYDPLEPLNRRIYRFNALVDEYLLLPALRVYKTVVPKPARTGVSNFFRNLDEINTFINTLLQADFREAGVTLARFLINSTIGLAGLFDPATALGLPRKNEDFGQTLAVYGVDAGPYLVLPFFGPTTLRGGAGLGAGFALDFVIDPLSLRGKPARLIAYWTLYALDTRKKQDFRYYQTGSPFEYALVRFIVVNYQTLKAAR